MRGSIVMRLQVPRVAAGAVHPPKEIAMRKMSTLRKSILIGGAMTAFVVAPLPLVAQSAPASGMPEQPSTGTMPAQAQPGTAMQQAPANTAPSSSSNETVPGKANDAWITTKVKSKLAAAKGVKASEMTVSTADGVVTLTGTATSTKEKSRAEHLAKEVKGVKSVDGSGLTVGSATSSGGAAAPAPTPPSGG
jgi:hyperosmotically inducible periplasmic protein